MKEQVFEGRYQLLAETANTRSYISYRAYDQIYKEAVVIQIYGRPSPSLDSKLSDYQKDNLNLFLQNAQQLKRLNEQAPSNYFQPVLECNVSTLTNQVYIVYRYIEDSSTLGQIVSFFPKVIPSGNDFMAEDGLEENIRTVYKRIWILEQAAVALDYAIQKGVPHNNLSMNAILVLEASSGGGSVWLTDFDLSSSSPGLNARVGQGWSPYASPEQRNGFARERTNDIYSFAAVAHEMIFGYAPKTPLLESPDNEREAIILELGQFFPKANGTLASVFGKALRFNPFKRHQTALEFVAELKKGLEIWLRDWTNYRIAMVARWQGDYQQLQNAALGLYTIDRLNREAWNTGLLQDELNSRVAAMSPAYNAKAVRDEVFAPPPGVMVEGLSYNQPENNSEVFEYSNDDFAKSTALELLPLQRMDLALPPTNDFVKFRPDEGETRQKDASPVVRYSLLVAVPLVIFGLAGLIIAFIIGSDNSPTPSTVVAAATSTVAANSGQTQGAAFATSRVTLTGVPAQTTAVANVQPTVATPTTAVTPAVTPTVAPTITPVPPSPTPTNFQNNLNTGLSFLGQGNFGAAKDSLQKALAEQPGNKDALRALNYADGGIYLADGDFSKAIIVLDSVYKENPNFLQVQPNLQVALIGLGDSLRGKNLDEAKKVYRQAANLQGARKDEANQKAAELGG
jgi:tetratricopeptide (TPR) repeat protein